MAAVPISTIGSIHYNPNYAAALKKLPYLKEILEAHKLPKDMNLSTTNNFVSHNYINTQAVDIGTAQRKIKAKNEIARLLGEQAAIHISMYGGLTTFELLATAEQHFSNQNINTKYSVGSIHVNMLKRLNKKQSFMEGLFDVNQLIKKGKVERFFDPKYQQLAEIGILGKGRGILNHALYQSAEAVQQYLRERKLVIPRISRLKISEQADLKQQLFIYQSHN